MSLPAVVVAHNRYRLEGGEERCVALQLAALQEAGIPWELLERRSSALSRAQAARLLLAGGGESSLADLLAKLRQRAADRRVVLHAHNLLPAFGPRLLEAAHANGVPTVLQLHNLRLSCAIGVAWRDRRPCSSCRGRFTLPAVVHRCRRSRLESAVYAAALARHFERTLGAVDRFVVPSAYARQRVQQIGVPPARTLVVSHYLPDEACARASGAGHGRYALVAARLSPEKGIERAIRACAAVGVPLVVAGEGPDRPRLQRLAESLAANCKFVGWVGERELRALRAEAACALFPSEFPEFAPYSALEALAAGVPAVATDVGALPEILGRDACVPLHDEDAFASRLEALWVDPDRRAAEGEAALARARTEYGKERYLASLMSLYGELLA